MPDSTTIVAPEPSAGAAVRAAGAPGLSAAEAAARLKRDGPNSIPPPPPVPLWRRVVRQLSDPLIIVLLVAAALTVATGDWPDTAVILLVIVVNTAVGTSQEIRADRAIAALSALAAPGARVVRDGVQQHVPAAGVVVGDLLVLAEGDIVPADATVTESAALAVDESALTGESVPVDKSPAAAAALSAGTVVVRGRGHATVTATGSASAIGRIAAITQGGSALTPLQRRLADVGRMLAAATVVLCALVLAVGLLRGQPVELMAVAAISLVVAAVPESLPAVVTLALALGARRMAARNALVRRLPAVETLGSVTVLATDKTGTLTEGRMAVRRLWTPAGSALVSGTGYGPDGEVAAEVADRAGPGARDAVEDLLAAAVLCNDARLRAPDDDGGVWTALGDPTEAALLAAGRWSGLERGALHADWPRVAEQPFDSERKRMTTVHRGSDGTVRIVCKGAPEALLTTGVLADGDGTADGAVRQAARWAEEGFRVLAVAGAERPAGSGAAAGEADHDLRLLGLIAIADPPRSAAVGTIAACRRAGVRTLLITGDHPGTARAVAAELGILAPGERVVDCRGGLDGAAARTASVFARATPRDKLDIVEALRGAGETVAMTGDGVNDGPALRAADIGVAMGARGTEVARQAADLVLADDDLDTVVAAVEEGRRVFANIRRFLVYALSGGFAEIAVMLFGPLFGLALPLLPGQILWINLLTHGLPGVALGGEPAEPGILDRPPRPPSQSILAAGLWQRVVRIGLVLSVTTLGIAVWGYHTGRPWQSMAFFALGASQLGVAIGSRARPRSLANPLLLVAVASALALQAAGLYLPLLRDLLGTQPLAAGDFLIVATASLVGFAAATLDRRLYPAASGAVSSRAAEMQSGG